MGKTSTRHPSPQHLKPEERLQEIAAIVAQGLLRIGQKVTPDEHPGEAVLLDFSSPQRVHDRP